MTDDSDADGGGGGFEHHDGDCGGGKETVLANLIVSEVEL